MTQGTLGCNNNKRLLTQKQLPFAPKNAIFLSRNKRDKSKIFFTLLWFSFESTERRGGSMQLFARLVCGRRLGHPDELDVRDDHVQQAEAGLYPEVLIRRQDKPRGVEHAVDVCDPNEKAGAGERPTEQPHVVALDGGRVERGHQHRYPVAEGRRRAELQPLVEIPPVV